MFKICYIYFEKKKKKIFLIVSPKYFSFLIISSKFFQSYSNSNFLRNSLRIFSKFTRNFIKCLKNIQEIISKIRMDFLKISAIFTNIKNLSKSRKKSFCSIKFFFGNFSKLPWNYFKISLLFFYNVFNS